MKRYALIPEGYESRGLTEKQVSKIIGLSVSTLRLDRHKRRGIPYYKIGKAVRYDPEDVSNFLESQKIMTEPR
jgi:hypothetical protein